MRIEVDIEDSKLQNLSSTAKLEIVKEGKIYLEELLDEASRIEESRRTASANAEITAAIINDAVIFAKRYGIKKKSVKRPIWIQILLYISSVLTGGLFQIDKFQNVLFLISFLVAFFISIAAAVYLIFIEAKND